MNSAVILLVRHTLNSCRSGSQTSPHGSGWSYRGIPNSESESKPNLSAGSLIVFRCSRKRRSHRLQKQGFMYALSKKTPSKPPSSSAMRIILLRYSSNSGSLKHGSQRK